ncbi:MAG: hypothetical protein ACMXX8_03785 [Candidatus Woesearchaeota archaeon]
MVLQSTILELIYTSLIIIPSLLIYFKTRKLYIFSKYENLRYFSNAFLFFSLAFFVRFIYFTAQNFKQSLFSEILLYNNYLLILFEFLFLLPGFYFLISLLYKKIIKLKKVYQYYIWCFSIILFLLISVIDYFFITFLFMYILATIIFFLNTLISYKNYLNKKSLYGQIFSISMMLILISWILNFATQNLVHQYPIIRYYIYLINVTALIIIFYIVNKLMKDF